MAQNYFDRDATAGMNAEFSNSMSDFPKTSLKGFSIPRVSNSMSDFPKTSLKGFSIPRVQTSAELSNSMSDFPKTSLKNVSTPRVQARLLEMAMPVSPPSEITNNIPEKVIQEQKSWSRPAYRSVDEVRRKRTFKEISSSKSWAESYDKQIPDSVLDLCLENECKLCGVQITNFILRKQHYEGAKHEKKVKLELSEIYKTGGETAPKKLKMDTDMSAENFLKKIEHQVIKETVKERRADFKVESWLGEWDPPLPTPILAMCRVEKCEVCEATFTSVAMAQSHFEGKNHKKKFKVCLEAFCQQNCIETPERMTDEPSLNEKYCKLCDVALTSGTMAQSHYAGRQHVRKQQAAAAANPDTVRFGIGQGFTGDEPDRVNVKVEDNDDLKNKLTNEADEDFMNGTWEGLKLKEEKIKVLKEEQTFPSEVSSNVSFSSPIKKFNPHYCKLCDLDLTSQVTYDAHIKGKNHKKKEDAINQPKDKFFCDVCNLNLNAQPTFESHIRGKQHAKKVAACDKSQGGYSCGVCDITTTDQNGLAMHLNGKSHKSKLRKMNGEP